MPAYNFQKRVVPAVESGLKRSTIRADRRGARRGGTAYLYTGQRTKSCRKLGEGTITDVLPIEIGRNVCSEPYACLTEDGKQINIVHRELEFLARDDGFETAEEMVEWMSGTYGLPFKGFLHKWDPK